MSLYTYIQSIENTIFAPQNAVEFRDFRYFPINYCIMTIWYV